MQQKNFLDRKNSDNTDRIIYRWEAPEFETYEKSRLWYVSASVFILGLVIYALSTGSPIMAITFLLFGVVGYIHLSRQPRIITFTITRDGIAAGSELYPFENISSFWIFYDPPLHKAISLHTDTKVLPFVHMPIHEENPTEIREILLQYIPEKKQDPSLTDAICRALNI